MAEARSKAVHERDVAGAISIVDGILGNSPDDAEALMLKGSLLELQGRSGRSHGTVRQAVQSKPDYLPAHTAIISVHMQKGALDDASKQLEAMKKAAPNNPQTRYLEAQLAYQRKDFKTTRDVSQQLLKAAPRQSPVPPDGRRSRVSAGLLHPGRTFPQQGTCSKPLN